MPGSLGANGSVKYYKGFLNHAYALNTINAQKNTDLTFRVSDSQNFEFKSQSGTNSTSLFMLNKNSSIFQNNVVLNSDCYLEQQLSVGGDAYFKGTTTISKTLTVSGETTVTGDMGVTGNLSVNNILEANCVIVNCHLSIGGDLTVEDDIQANSMILSGTLSVAGNVNIEQDLSVANILYVKNSVIIEQDLSVNSNIVCGAQISTETLSVGGNAVIGGYMRVGDSVMIQNCNSNAVFCNYELRDSSLSDFALYQNSSGQTRIGATAGNSVYIKDDNMIVGDSRIELNCQTFIQNTLSVSGLTTLNSLLVNSMATFNNVVEIKSTGFLSVKGESFFSNDVQVDSNLTVTGTSSVQFLSVSGNATLNSVSCETLSVQSHITIGYATISHLSVMGTVFVDKLIVSNCATFNCHVNVIGELSVDGLATFNSHVTVNGNVVLSGDNNKVVLNNTGGILMHGPTTGTGVTAHDDFHLYNSNGNFNIELVHLTTDAVNFSNVVNSAAYPARITMNSQQIDIVGNNEILLETATGGSVNMNAKLSVSGEVTMNSSLSVGGDVYINTDPNNNKQLKISTGSDHVQIAESSKTGNADFMLRQYDTGNVQLNAPTGQTVTFKNAGNSVMVVAGGSVSVSKAMYVNSTLSVSGVARFDNNVSVSGNMVFGSGNATITGDISVSGNLSVVGAATFDNNVTMNDTVTVSGDMTIDSTGSLSVGGLAKLNELSVSGNVQINSNLSVVQTITTQNLSVANSIVLGDFFMQNTGNALEIKKKGAGTTDNLRVTNDTTTIKNTTIKLQDDGGADAMVISTNCVEVNKPLSVSSSVTIDGTLSTSGAVTINSLVLASDSNGATMGYIGNTAGFNQNSDGDTTLTGNDSVTFQIGNADKMVVNATTVTIHTDTTIVNDLSVTNALSVGRGLFVKETSRFDGAVTINNTLSVSGVTTVDSDLSVGGTTFVNGDTIISNCLRVDGDVHLNGNLIVQGTSTVVNVESTHVTFDDNTIVLASNCGEALNTAGSNLKSGLYIHNDGNSAPAFFYNNGVSGGLPGWTTQNADLGVAAGKKLFFNANDDINSTTPHGWSIELATDDDSRGDNSMDMVFKYYDGNTTDGVVKLRIASADDDFDEDL